MSRTLLIVALILGSIVALVLTEHGGFELGLNGRSWTAGKMAPAQNGE